MFGTLLAVLLIVHVSQRPIPQSKKVCSAAPQARPAASECTALGRGDTAAAPAFPICHPSIAATAWKVTRPPGKAMFTTPTSPDANFWHWGQCQIIPRLCLSLGKKGMGDPVPCPTWCFLPPLWKGPHQLRDSLSSRAFKLSYPSLSISLGLTILTRKAWGSDLPQTLWTSQDSGFYSSVNK